MGWWSDSIMGGDSPLDIQSEFEDTFGASKPTPEASVALIQKLIAEGEDDYTAKQVVGFLVMDRKAPMSPELRTLVLEGIDGEDPEEIGWSDVPSREQKLYDFRKLVEAYPVEGGGADMPHQPGLFEVILGGQSDA